MDFLELQFEEFQVNSAYVKFGVLDSLRSQKVKNPRKLQTDRAKRPAIMHQLRCTQSRRADRVDFWNGSYIAVPVPARGRPESGASGRNRPGCPVMGVDLPSWLHDGDGEY